MELTAQRQPQLRAAYPAPTDRLQARLWAGAVALVCAALLGAGYWLRPDPSGVGTHQQFGLGPCSTLALTGVPCATCGMTTAVSHAAHGELAQAFVAQPAGAVLAIVAAALELVALYALVRGISLAPLGRWAWRPRTILVMVVVVLVSWGYKILHVYGVI